MSFDGVFCPVVTPFVANRLHPESLAANIKHLSASGLAGFLVLGSTGEAVLLSSDEKKDVLQAAREAIPKNRLLIFGASGEATVAVIDSIEFAAKAGADCALVITPGYFKGQLDNAAQTRHYLQIAERSPLPILIYNVPKFTGFDLDVSVVRELAQHPMIKGIKDSTAAIVKLHELTALQSQDFHVLIGNAGLLFSGLISGARGAILALCNFAASACVKIYEAVAKDDFVSARDRFMQILPLATRIVGQGGVPAIKAAMDALGLQGGEPRSPLLPLNSVEKSDLRTLLKQAGLL